MARPSRYSSSVIQRFSWMMTRRIQKFTPPKPEAPMRAKVRKISPALLCIGSLESIKDGPFSIDDLVRTQQHALRDGEAERLGGLLVHVHLGLGHLLHRQ